MAEAAFSLDPRLESTSFPVADWPLCHVRLCDDARWPWLLLIPRREGVVELFDLTAEDRAVLIEEATLAATVVRDLIGADKTNVATLGNQVPQLHVHAIGRLKTDPAWPGPVWGVGQAVPYDATDRAALIGRIRSMVKL